MFFFALPQNGREGRVLVLPSLRNVVGNVQSDMSRQKFATTNSLNFGGDILI